MSETKTTREKALIWWSNLPFNSNNTGKGKINYTFKYYGLDRKYDSLTGREIEEIYLKETLSLEEKESKFGMYKNDNIMNIQTINNKHYTELDVVILETKDTSKLWLNTISNQLHYDTEKKVTHHQAVNQHIYFLSNEKLKESDYAYDKILNLIFQTDKFTDLEYINQICENIRKVEATTDSSLTKISGKIPSCSQFTLEEIIDANKTIPQIPQQFTKHFITEYNKGNVITKVKVKVDLHDNDISCDKWKIMTNDNEIIPLIDVLEFTPFHKPDLSHLKVKTAVDWFANEIDNLLPYVNEKIAKQFNDLIEKAKAVEQQHIETAFDKGISSVLKNFDKAYSDIDGEEYYKQNFKQ
jgi:hypothetical protein